MSRVEKWMVPVAALEAAATGLVLIVSPPLFSWLVLGVELTDSGQALARLAGIALIGAGLAAWSPPAATTRQGSARALFVYNLLAALYLVYLGIDGRLVGVLLWPAVALHAGFAVLVAPLWLRRRPDPYATRNCSSPQHGNASRLGL